MDLQTLVCRLSVSARNPVAVPAPVQRWLIVAVVFGLLAATGAGGYLWWSARDTAQRLELFYGDTQAMFLVPIEKTVPLPPPERASEWAQAVFAHMRSAPDRDVTSLVTPEVKLLAATWVKPTWTLHVQLGPGMGSVSEKLLAGSLVRTFLASYPGAEQVELRFFGADGKPYLSQHLDLSKPLTARDFSNQVGDGANRGLQATLWWMVQGGEQLVPVQVALAGGTGSPARDAFDRLVSGPPSDAGAFLRPVVPAGLTPEWSALEGGVAMVNLNREVPAGASGERFIEATVLTLTEFPTVTAVQFLRDGLPMPAHVGPYQLDKPIRRPQDVNEAPAAAQP